jgi:hypothetical protein
MIILPAPDSLVENDGRLRFGVFAGVPRRADLERARLDVGGIGLPAPLARLRLKQWQHVAIVTPHAFVGLAIVDAAYLRLTWCHVVDRTTGAHFEHVRKAPALDLHVTPDVWDSRSHVRARGYRAAIESQLKAGEHRVVVDIDAARDLPSFACDLVCPTAGVDPLAVLLPVGGGRGMYSLKVPLPARGVVRIGGVEREVDAATSFGIWDVHAAHYPRRTFWQWATFAGRDARGRAIGLNLTRNVNLDDEALNENALWVDGAIHRLGPARFEMDPARPLEPWHVGTVDGAVELVFRPEGLRSEDLRLGVVETVFRQPYGTFSGVARTAAGEVPIQGLFGVCEDHHSIW